MGALLAAVVSRLGEALGRQVDLRLAEPVGGGYVAQAGKMMDRLSAEA